MPISSRGLKTCVIVPAHWDAVMGGSQYQAKMLVEHMLAKGEHRVFYVARQLPKSCHAVGYEVVRISSPKRLRKYGTFFDSRSLLRILEEISPDVIYQRVGCAYTGIAAYYANRHGKRCTWHVAHDEEVMPMEWHLTRDVAFRYVDKLLLEHGVRNVQSIVTQTQQQANYLYRHYGRRPDAVIPNYHPLPRTEPRKAETTTVVWVANLKPWKRPELFLKLARELAWMKDVQFVMVGSPMGRPAWWQRILEEASTLANLRYFGAQSQDSVNELLSRAHIFVNTSTHEGFANTFIQSWLRRVPVMSLSVNPDGVFDDRKVGICAGTFDDLKVELVDLIRDERRRANMGDEARAFAAAKYANIGNLEKLAHMVTVGANDGARLA